jgi:phosphoglycolate phosphatase-like HAD superfamily hydrolase
MICDLIWDVDGTLFDTYPAIAQAMMLALGELGGEAPPEHVDRLCKVSFGHAVAVLAEACAVDADALFAGFYRCLDALPVEDQRPFPGVAALCEHVLSIGGGNFIITHRHRASLERLLAAHTMRGYFVDAVTGDDGFPRKPDPTGLNALIARNGIRREQALVIGDRGLDVAAAHAAGVRACFFGTNPHLEPAEFEVLDYATLLRLLRK